MYKGWTENRTIPIVGERSMGDIAIAKIFEIDYFYFFAHKFPTLIKISSFSAL